MIFVNGMRIWITNWQMYVYSMKQKETFCLMSERKLSRFYSHISKRGFTMKTENKEISMLLYNNQRKMNGKPMWRKKNRKKRICTRNGADETITAFCEYCDQK